MIPGRISSQEWPFNSGVPHYSLVLVFSSCELMIFLIMSTILLLILMILPLCLTRRLFATAMVGFPIWIGPTRDCGLNVWSALIISVCRKFKLFHCFTQNNPVTCDVRMCVGLAMIKNLNVFPVLMFLVKLSVSRKIGILICTVNEVASLGHNSLKLY